MGGSWLDGRGEPDGTGVMRRPGPDGETVEEPMQVWLGKGKAGTSTDWASHKEQLNAPHGREVHFVRDAANGA